MRNRKLLLAILSFAISLIGIALATPTVIVGPIK